MCREDNLFDFFSEPAGLFTDHVIIAWEVDMCKVSKFMQYRYILEVIAWKIQHGNMGELVKTIKAGNARFAATQCGQLWGLSQFQIFDGERDALIEWRVSYGVVAEQGGRIVNRSVVKGDGVSATGAGDQGQQGDTEDFFHKLIPI